MTAPEHLDSVTEDQRRRVVKMLKKSRGLIVMASTDPAVQTTRIPIEWPLIGGDVLERDMAEAMSAIDSAAADARTRTLASVFREVWHERNGKHVAQNQETCDNFLIWGNLLIEATPHRHVVLVETGQAIDILLPIIATRRIFLKWVDEKLPTKIEELRRDRGLGVSRH
jgi:hypothetical protein